MYLLPTRRICANPSCIKTTARSALAAGSEILQRIYKQSIYDLTLQVNKSQASIQDTTKDSINNPQNETDKKNLIVPIFKITQVKKNQRTQIAVPEACLSTSNANESQTS